MMTRSRETPINVAVADPVRPRGCRDELGPVDEHVGGDRQDQRGNHDDQRDVGDRCAEDRDCSSGATSRIGICALPAELVVGDCGKM